MYDCIIIGSGPAGLSAGIYSARAGFSTLILDASPLSGGQILNTFQVDNYPGLPGISGMDLGKQLRNHAESLGVGFTTARVKSIEDCGSFKKLITKNTVFETKSVIIATGARTRALGVENEDKLLGAGVSYCATCDGAFYRDQNVAVVGGGNTALEDAIYLSRGCKKVYIIHRRQEFRGDAVLVEQVKATPNIQILTDSVIEAINGRNQVESLTVKNTVSGEFSKLEVSGLFIAVGMTPNTSDIEGLPSTDEFGYIIAGEDGITNIPGVFAAGDVRTKVLRQVITATSDGANAVSSVQKYISGI